MIVAETYSDGAPLWNHRLRMIKALDKMYDVIYTSGMILSDSQFRSLEQASSIFLLEYSYLAREALAANRLQYSVVPKFHYLCHIVQAAKFLNPRWTWCYGGEDLVGSISALAHSCTSGTSALQVQAKLMEKYRVAKHIAWAMQ